MTTSVTYPANVGGDNITIDDSDNTTTGLGNGGHRTRFMIAMAQFLKVADWVRVTAQTVLGYRDAAATSAGQALTYASAAQAAAGVPAIAGKANYVFVVNPTGNGVLWTNAPTLLSLTADSFYGKALTLTNTNPLIRLNDTSQTGTAGLFDVRSSGGSYALLRNTAAARDFSSVVYEHIINNAGRHLFGGAADDAGYKYNYEGNLKCNGNIWAVNVTAPSDITLKTDIETLVGALGMVKRLRGVRHGWKGDDSGRKDIGVIAQDLLKDLPELVLRGDDGKLAVNYPKLAAVLIEAIKEQDIRLTALEAR